MKQRTMIQAPQTARSYNGAYQKFIGEQKEGRKNFLIYSKV
jgi:hypothetical protein